MILLAAFAFLAGIITVLSPCILPILPIVLTSSFAGKDDRKRPYGVIAGFIASFTFFTLFLSTIVRLTGVPANSLRYFSIFVIAGFGISLLVPTFQTKIEKVFTKLSRFAPTGQNNTGFFGGLVVGVSLGLLWTPCVGPILASVISLAITGSVSLSAVIITLAYAIGTSIPMLLIIKGGQRVLQQNQWLVTNTAKIQKLFGVVMILLAVGIYFNVDRQFQSYILDVFPSYGTGLTKLEENSLVRSQLDNLSDTPKAIEKPGMMTPAPELIPGGQWFNSEPLTIESLRGKVVLVDFWTYTCINCQRTFPYLRAWWQQYQDEGLVIIGVHAPEFEFEKDPNNVNKAINDFELTYPIMQDNDFKTWRAYLNRYWPAKYLIDKSGNIRYTHFGEGKYEETEDMIRYLLTENASLDLPEKTNQANYQLSIRTPELYLGYSRLEFLASPEDIVQDELTRFSYPTQFPQDHFGLDGSWLITKEYAEPSQASRLKLQFQGKDVFLVMNPTTSSNPSFSATLDGDVVGLGPDVISGEGLVTSDRLYHLVKLGESGVHTLELVFPDGNIQLFAITFG